MIVDDEEHVRESIYYKIDHQYNRIGLVDQVENAYDALEKMTHISYDIVITDIKMPEMDGLELIGEAKKRNFQSNFIIISGYDEFDYARRAIKLGVVDYLLKPVNQVVLNDLINQIWLSQDLARVIEDQSLINPLNIKRDRSHDLLNDLLWRCNKDNMKHVIHAVSSLFSHEFYRVLVLHFRPIKLENTKSIEALSRLIQRKISLTNQACDLEFVEHQGHRNELAIIMNFDKDQDELSILQYIIRMLIKDYSIEVAIGIGEVTNQLEQVRTSYNEAYFSVLEKMLHGYNKLYYKDKIKKGNFRLSDNRRKLMEHYLQQYDQENLMLIVEDVLKQMGNNQEINHVNVVSFATNLFLMLKRYGNIKAANRSDEEFIFDLYACNSLFEVREMLNVEIKRYLVKEDNQFDCSRQIVEDAVIFIREHSDEVLSLEKMAKTYHIHPNYFSRIFKMHRKVNFNEFVTQIRMGKAMELLKSPEMKVYEVSSILGYSDAKYFSKVFKRFHGISPSRVIKDK